MLGKKRRAGTRRKATALNHNNLNGSYQSCVSKASTKLERVGTLLLALQTPLNCEQQENGWQFLEAALRQYYDLKFIEVQQ